MKIFGYASDESELMRLKEITLNLSAEELQIIINFLTNTLGIIKKSGDKFEHEHFKDFLGKQKKDYPDIIITSKPKL